MATHTLMTAEQFDRLPVEEGRKYELLDGELLEVSSPTPEHSRLILILASLIETFLRSQKKVGAPVSDTEFAFGDRRLIPDIAVVLGAKWRSLDRKKVPVTVCPDVAVEIVSPSESARDITRKTEAYLQSGVTEVVLVYPDERLIFVHSAAGVARFRSGDSLMLTAISGFSTSIDQVFARI